MKYFIMISLICLISSQIFGTGIDQSNIGLRATGLGGAFTGVADDSSAVYWNAAGLAFYKGKGELNAGAYLPYITIENQRTSSPNNGFKSKSETFNLIPHFFACYKLTEDFAVGFGFYFPYGGGKLKFTDALDGDSFYTQKYNLEKDLRSYTFTASASYKFNHIFSFGMGLSFYYITLETITTNKTLGAGVTGNTDEFVKGSTISGNIGFMLKPLKNLSLGLSARLPAKLTLEGDFEISNSSNTGMVPNSKKSSYKKIKAPLNIGFGIGFYPMESWLISADIEYQMWSMADEVLYKTNPSSTEKTYHYGWKNTLRFGLGNEFLLSDSLSIIIGFKINPGAAEQTFLGLDNTDLTAYAFFLGLGVKLTNNIKLEGGISYVFYSSQNQSVTDNNVALKATGDFKKNIIGTGLQIKYTF